MEQVEYYDNIAGDIREYNGKNAVLYRSKAAENQVILTSGYLVLKNWHAKNIESSNLSGRS
jgi:hypothetical protein